MPSRSAPSNLSKSQRGIPLVHCGAKTRAGTPCKKVAGFGTDHVGYGHCKLHGGASPNGIRNAAVIEYERRHLTVVAHIEPHEALQKLVDIANGEVEFYTLKIASLTEDDLLVEHLHVKQAPDGTTVDRTNQRDLHAWVQARAAAQERLARYAKMAIDAGCAERLTRVAEEYGQQLAEAFAAVFAELHLTPEQKKAAQPVVRKHLLALEGGATG